MHTEAFSTFRAVLYCLAAILPHCCPDALLLTPILIADSHNAKVIDSVWM